MKAVQGKLVRADISGAVHTWHGTHSGLTKAKIS